MVSIRDAVHGNVELNALEERVLDCAPLQRLRDLHQLATAYLVFPSARHSRFEHSLGTFYLAGKLCAHLGLSKEKSQETRLAALLHDVGHGAFSHLSEPFLKKHLRKSHEELGVMRVRESEVAAVLEDGGISLGNLEKILLSKTRDSAIVSGDLGCDRVDYLLRDALFCGVAYSVVDAQRLIETLKFEKGELAVGEKGRVPAESLLVSRYLMFNSVYFHHAVRISYEMVRKAVDSAFEKGAISIEAVSLGSDALLLHKLCVAKEPLACRVSGRKLLKRAFALNVPLGGALEKFFEDKETAARELDGVFSRASGGGEFVCCLPEVHSKPFKVRVLDSNGACRDLSAISPLAKALEAENAERELIVACAPEKKSAVSRAAEKFFASFK